MSITVTQFHTHLDAARVAIGAGDYATAETQAMQAQTCLAGLPNGQDAGQSQVEWRETVERLLDMIRTARKAQAVSAVGGIQRSKISYV